MQEVAPSFDGRAEIYSAEQEFVNPFYLTRTRQGYDRPMTSSYVIAVECEGFLPLDPRDPENLDRKADDRDRAHNPAAADTLVRQRDRDRQRQAKEWRKDAEKQRSDLLDLLDAVTTGGKVRLADKLIRDDGTAILYFSFDPGPEGDHFVRHRQVELDQNSDSKKGSVVTGRTVVTTEPHPDTEGEGAVTWDSALRNEIEQARSSVVGAGLQVVGVKVEVHEKGQKSGASAKSRGKEANVTDQQGPTHQETQGSDEPNLSDPEVQDQRAEELREQAQDREATAEAVADNADQSKGKRSKS